MSLPDPIEVDQALFGYSDGHRQIASSVRLAAKDQYQLAAATDLASGVTLGPEQSYLTGLPLSESRRYALIRTWSAPEMPRPGCVWSHVVLIDPRLLASHGDLGDFVRLLAHPSFNDKEAYGEPLRVERTTKSDVLPNLRTAISLVGQYYSGERALLDPSVPAPELEAAIVAVWSQQWPRLRSAFSFRTAPGAERRRSELISYDVQLGAGGAISPVEGFETWVIAAAKDAVLRQVTPLRRFLWRYGRDISAARRHYRTLVEFFISVTVTNGVSAKDAIRVFDTLTDADDGVILKRDILGIGSASPPLFPSLAPDQLLRLLASKGIIDLAADEGLRTRFKAIPSSQVATLANFVERHGHELGRWADIIDDGLVAAADREVLSGALPGRIRRLILSARPELIDRETVSSLSDEALVDLSITHARTDFSPILAYTIVRRDLGSAHQRLIATMPREIFEAAVDASLSNQLDPSWIRTVSLNVQMILQTKWPVGVPNTSRLACGLALLNFPTKIDWTSAFWTAVLGSMIDDVQDDERTRLNAFLLLAALRDFSKATWRLISKVLPEIRPIVLRGELPNDAYYMLGSELPKFSSVAYWDLNKRILMSLSYLLQKVPDAGALQTLDLSDRELETVLTGADVEAKRSASRPWFWF